MTTTRTRPILFSGPMGRAILDDRKTQTRRPVRFKRADPVIHAETHGPFAGEPEGTRRYTFDHQSEHGIYVEDTIRCPYGQPGDRLWVKEAARLRCRASRYRIEYRADGHVARLPDDDPGEVVLRWIERAKWVPLDGEHVTPWRPSIHLPKSLSRLKPEVTDVRVERVKDLSEDDAKAEGMSPIPWCDSPYRMSFAGAWTATYGKRGLGWDANPWVWVVTFARDAGATE